MNIKELLFDWNQHSFGEKELARVWIFGVRVKN
jgi:hypothetical protein